MKYIVLIGDGMADRPLKILGYKTCLQKAHTPYMDRIAREGETGAVRTIPDGFEPGSDVANLSILGYNPLKYYSGRAPIEAAYRKIKLGLRDVAFRCNLVTLSAQISETKKGIVMEDYSAGHITTKESTSLILEINKRMGNKKISFYPGVSYRHLMVWKNGKEKTRCTPPHDITGKKIYDYLPSGTGREVILSLMKSSSEVLLSHPVNKKRIRMGQRPANSIWLWGQGKRLKLPKFRAKYGLKGALISAVDLTKGLGISAGFDIINVKGATGYIDTNYLGKAKAALRALKTYDIVYLHVEAPDEAGHMGDVMTKMRAIEDFDSRIVGPVLKGIEKFKAYRILMMPDHATPIRMKTHSDEPVPFVIYGNNFTQKKPGTGVKSYSENICRIKNVRVFDKGHKLMEYFVKQK